MKKIVLSVLAFAILPLSASADCQSLAEQAALNFAKSTAGESIAWDVGGSQLMRRSRSTLIYEVELLSSTSDGASSDEFPGEIFVVRAIGTTKACKITGVKSK